MEKIKNSKNMNTKKNLLSTTLINKNNENKNSILKRIQKSIEKRKKIIHNTNKSLIVSALDKTKFMTKPDSNNFTILYISEHKKNFSKIFSSNSCKKRKLKNNKTNNVFNKTINKKLTNIDKENKPNCNIIFNRIKTNLKNSFNTSRYKPSLTNSNIFMNYNKSNKSNDHLIKVKKPISRNQNTLNTNKLLNRSVEIRNKMKKLQLKENSKTKLIKNKTIEKHKTLDNPEKLNSNEFNNKEKNSIDEGKSNTENCQTFSNKENDDTNENVKTICFHKNENEDENKLRISTNYDKGTIEDISMFQTSIVKKENKTKNLFHKMIKNKADNKNKNKSKKLKNIINEFCINNSRLNINKNNKKIIKEKKLKNSKMPNNDFLKIKKEKKFIKALNDCEISRNNNEIFETISDIKVKSYNEYNQEQNTIPIDLTEQKNESQLNNSNININININYNNINVNNPSMNTIEDNFIKDRDEYNIDNFKETFSKDRFSFKPINNEIIPHCDCFNSINIKRGELNKMDFMTNTNNNKETLINKDNKNKEEKNKFMKGKLNKIKKFNKTKVNSKLNKGKISLVKPNILNKGKK